MKCAVNHALIDCGAQGRFVDESKVKDQKKRVLRTPLTVKNVDGTRNAAGRIVSETRLQYSIGDQDFEERFYVTQLGDQDIIL